MLKDINYEYYIFAEISYCSINWQNKAVFCQQVTEGAMTPIQDCFPFRIVIACEQLQSLMEHRETPMFYCAEPKQSMYGAANPHEAEEGADRTWQDKCNLLIFII